MDSVVVVVNTLNFGPIEHFLTVRSLHSVTACYEPDELFAVVRPTS